MITVIIGIVVVIVIVCAIAGIYNNMVTKRNRIDNAWQNIDTQLQRRNDLIPNLVATVKGYADFEQKTLTDVVEARAKATQITVDPSQLTPAALEQFQSAQGELSQALGRLMVVAERYPDLKANQNFLELQSQLEGTENRISVARQRFNQAASAYNAYILKFPSNLIAGMFGFDRATLFQADESAQAAPKVEF